MVLVVLDGSQELTDEDQRVLDEVRERPAIIVINKADLPRKARACSGMPAYRSACPAGPARAGRAPAGDLLARDEGHRRGAGQLMPGP